MIILILIIALSTAIESNMQKAINENKDKKQVEQSSEK